MLLTRQKYPLLSPGSAPMGPGNLLSVLNCNGLERTAAQHVIMRLLICRIGPPAIMSCLSVRSLVLITQIWLTSVGESTDMSY